MHMRNMTAGYEILDRPADLGLRAWAANLPDLFAECGKALTDVIVDIDTINPADIHSADIMAEDIEGLLFNWMSEILYLFDGEKKIFCQFAITGHRTAGGTEYLQAEMRGERYDPERHQIKTYVKAVTFHQLSIKHGEGGYVAEIYLDI